MDELFPEVARNTESDRAAVFARIVDTGAHGLHTSQYAQVYPVGKVPMQQVMPGFGHTGVDGVHDAEHYDGNRGADRHGDSVL